VPRRIATTLLALLGVLIFAALAACSGIPRSGPVQAGDAIGTDDDIDVIFLAADPVKGASQQDILNGFILAAKSPQDDYQIARRYLTKSAADAWKPNEGATVDTGPRPTTALSDTELQMSVTPVASVDSNGAYTESTSSAPLPLTFSFTQVDGEWRIDQLADGIVIEDLFFDQVFSSHALYFYDPTFTYLVPDLRWFPSSTAVGTRVVKALLAGPSAWLGDGAVVTAFPDGTSATAVVTTGGQTQVELSSNVLQADANDLERMQYQLRTSLSDLASSSTVAISVDQNIVPIPGSNVTPPDWDPRVDSRPLVLRDGAFGYLAGSSVAPIPSISDGVEALQAQGVAYSATARTAAVKAGNGQVYAVRGTDVPASVDQRPGLIVPAVDPFGYVWTVPTDAPTSVTVYGAGEAGAPISTSWDGASGITSLEISRDGTRALAFLSVDGVPKLVVAAVIRNQDGVPQRLGQPVELSTGQGAPVDATWVDQLTVASVTALPSGENRAVAQVLGGRSSSLGAPVGAVSAAGGNDLDGLRVLSNDGGLQQQRGSAWQATTTGISLLAVQS
jgi:hypothetical protein